jgi:uncharacterized membrane protein
MIGQQRVLDTTRVDAINAGVWAFDWYGFLTGITVLLGLIIAYLQRDKTDRVSQSHFQFQITTFWIGLLYFFVEVLTLHIGIGALILLWYAVWTVIRCVKVTSRFELGRTNTQSGLLVVW